MRRQYNSQYNKRIWEWGEQHPMASGILGLLAGGYIIKVTLAKAPILSLIGVGIIVAGIRRIYISRR